VGQDEDAQPLVRCANFCRREQTRRRRVAQSPKLSQDGFKAEGDVTGYVFEEDPCGGTFPDDAGDLEPEVAGVIGPLPLSGGAERLAWVSGDDGVDGTSEGLSVECGEVVPYGRGGEVSGLLGSDENGSGVFLPLDKASRVEAWLGKHEAHIKSSTSCAEGESIPGAWHHVILCFLHQGFHSGGRTPARAQFPAIRAAWARP
jgi:hypothetical protein